MSELIFTDIGNEILLQLLDYSFLLNIALFHQYGKGLNIPVN